MAQAENNWQKRCRELEQQLADARHELEVLRKIAQDGSTDISPVINELKRAFGSRDKTREALAESQEKFHVLAERSPNMVFINTNGRISYVNQRCEELLGYTRAELLDPDFNFINLIAPENREAVGHSYQRHAQGAETETIEYPVIAKDGHAINTITTTVLIPDENALVIMGIVTDITYQKAIQSHLADARKQHQTLIENTHDIIYTLDPETEKITFITSNIKRYGYTPEDIIGNAINVLVHPDDMARIREELNHTTTSGQSVPTSFRLECADGSHVHVEETVRAIEADGMPVEIVGSIRDISERIQAEAALRESEQRFRLIFENARDAIFWADPQTGLIANCNQSAAALTGYAREEIIGMHQTHLHPKDKQELYAGIFAKHIRNNGAIDTDAEVARKDGTIRHVHISASVTEIEGSLLVQGIFHDVTEQHTAIKALEESEEKFRLLSEVTSAAVFIHQGVNFIYVNPATIRYSGYTEEELLNMPFWGIIHPDAQENVKQLGLARLTGKDVANEQTYEIPYLTKAGEMRWISINAIRIEYQGTPSILSTAFDITDRKTAEEELLKFKAIADNANAGVVVVEPDGTITYINQYMAGLHGYKPEELIGESSAKMHSPEQLSSMQKLIEKLRHNDTISNIEHWQCHKDGTAFPLLLNCVVIRSKDDAPPYAVITAVDLTERKRAEREQKRLEDRLARSEKMEALGRLAGGVVHDLSNILSPIVGYPDLLLTQLDADSPIRTALLAMKESGEKAAAIIDDLLTLTRRRVIQTAVLNLNTTIREYVKSPEYAGMMSEHPEIKVITKLDDKLDNIIGSEIHLSKTLMNLIHNGAEAISNQGTITVSTENCRLQQPLSGYTEIAAGDYIKLTISDSGTGIAEHELNRIFEPFYTRKIMGRSGTGLGLTIVWGTVEDHKGYITVDSIKGQGTTFTIYLPATKDKIGADQKRIPLDEYSGTESILVIDDKKEQREIITMMLERLGYTVTAVASGEEALDYVQEEPVDLLIIDVIMDPGMDGFETMQAVQGPHPDQKAIFVSGYTEPELIMQARKMGVHQYIKKPYTLQKMGMAVRAELDRS